MYSTHLTYQSIGQWLNLQFKGLYLHRCFSTGKDELHFDFRGSKGIQRFISLRFADGEMYFTFPAVLPGFGAGCIPWFRDLENKRLESVKVIVGDRLLLLDFGDPGKLLFKGFGKLGNVIYFSGWNQTPESIFRQNLKKDLSLPPLKGTDFVEAAVENEQSVTAEIENLNNRCEAILKLFFLNREKSNLLKTCLNQITHLQKIAEKTQERLQESATRRSYKELGDIILTYAHLVKQGISSAFLPDYYTGQQIRIKLDPDLDAAGNARKYYKKSQNEIIEREKLEETLIKTQSQLRELLAKREQIEQVQTFADLKPFSRKSAAVVKAQQSKPYKEFIIDDFTIWVGKNAKSNDEMLKLAAKNDLWLHARDWAGSHVIIKKKGKEFPKEVVNKAAKLAVDFSKGKGNSLVSVIVTERKYVVKPKNAAPGEVRVLKESIVDVFGEK